MYYKTKITRSDFFFKIWSFPVSSPFPPSFFGITKVYKECHWSWSGRILNQETSLEHQLIEMNILANRINELVFQSIKAFKWSKHNFLFTGYFYLVSQFSHETQQCSLKDSANVWLQPLQSIKSMNSLPLSILSATSLSGFRRGLDSFDLSSVLKGYALKTQFHRACDLRSHNNNNKTSRKSSKFSRKDADF